MFEVEKMSQEEIQAEIKSLEKELNINMLVILLILLFAITNTVLTIMGILPFNIISIAILILSVVATKHNISKGKVINFKLFVLDIYK
jgi:hypothetical protein